MEIACFKVQIAELFAGNIILMVDAALHPLEGVDDIFLILVIFPVKTPLAWMAYAIPCNASLISSPLHPLLNKIFNQNGQQCNVSSITSSQPSTLI